MPIVGSVQYTCRPVSLIGTLTSQTLLPVCSALLLRCVYTRGLGYHCVGPFKPSFTKVMVLHEPFEIVFKHVNFGLDRHDVVISFMVLVENSKQPPVVKVRDCFAKHMVGCQWPNENIKEPWGERGSRFAGP